LSSRLRIGTPGLCVVVALLTGSIGVAAQDGVRFGVRAAPGGAANLTSQASAPDSVGLHVLGGDETPDIIVGAGAGAPFVRALSGVDGAELGSGVAFEPGFTGGVRVAAGDVTGDGVADVVAAMGPPGGRVSLFDGATGTYLTGGYPFGASYTGGVYAAVGDVNGDGRADIVVGQGVGGQYVVFDGANPAISIGTGSPFGAGYTGGVTVATGDVNADGRAEVIVGQATGGQVAVFSGSTSLASGAPFGGSFSGGVFVAAGDVNGDGRAEVIASPLSGTGAVHVYDVATSTELASFAPYGPAFPGGIRVAAADITGDGRADIITAPGPGSPPILRAFSGATLAEIGSVLAFVPTFGGGVYVAAPTLSALRFTSASATSFTVGTSGTFTVRVTSTTPVTIARTGTLPAGVTWVDNGNGTGTLAGTPASGSGGAYALTFTATNSGGRTVTQSFALTIRQAPAITSAAATTFARNAAGTFTVTASGFPTPTLQSTGALPAGVTFTANSNGTATIAGTPTTDGSFPLTITATNGVGTAAAQNFTLTVSGAPAFTSASSTSFQVNVAGTFTVTTVGTPPVTTITRTGSLPTGVTFSDNGNGTATLAGTPGVGTSGTYPLTFTATNGVNPPATQNFTLSVGQAPAITSAAATTFVRGSAGSFTVTTSGVPTPALQLSGTLPTGVTFTDNANGTANLAGTPTQAGTFPLAISANNGIGSAATQSFTLTVNAAPAITSANATTFLVGAPGTFTVTTTGTPAVTTIAASGALPAGVTFTNNGNGTATLAGTPQAGTGGTYPLTITAANGVNPQAAQSFTLTVQQSPAFTSATSTSVPSDAAFTFNITASGSPLPTITRAGTLPAGVSFTGGANGAAALQGTPTVGGDYPLTFTADNGVGAPATQNFTLTVACAAVTITSPAPGALTAFYNTPYSQTFTASGGLNRTFAVTAGSLPTGLNLSSAGVLSGTPTGTGTSFTVTATSSCGSAGSASYSISVVPNAVDDTFNGGVGNTQFVVGGSAPSTPAVFVSGSVLGNDVGPGTLTAGPASIVSTSGGAVQMASNGTFVYTPPAGFAGPSDTFTYTLTDGGGATDTAVVTINLSTVVWYVNSSAANGDGRSHNPFNSVAGAVAASSAGQTIYVHTGAATTPGAALLKTGQVLWGQGAIFARNGLTIPGGTRPTLSSTLTLATDATVTGLALSTGAATGVTDPAAAITGVSVTGVPVTGTATAIDLSNATGTFSFESVNVNGGSNAISLNAVGGAFSVTGISAAGSGGTIQNVTGDAIRLSNTTAPVSLSHMVIQDIGSMGGASNTVSGHDAIHGEVVTGGLTLNDVTIRRISDSAINGTPLAGPLTTATSWNGLTMTNSLIENTNRWHVGGVADGGQTEGMVRIVGLTGTVSLTGNTFQNGNEPLDVTTATSGALTLTMTGNTVQSAYKELATAPTFGEQCVDVLVKGSTTATVTIGDLATPSLGNTFLHCRLGSIRLDHDTGATGTFNAVVAHDAFTVTDHSSPAGGDFDFPMGGVLARTFGAGASAMNVRIADNTFTEVTNASGGVGQLTLDAEGGTFQARVENNAFTRPGNAPWFVRGSASTGGRVQFRNNTYVGGTFSCDDPSCGGPGGSFPSPALRSLVQLQNAASLSVVITDEAFAVHDTSFDPGATVEVHTLNVGGPSTACAQFQNDASPHGYGLKQFLGTINLFRTGGSGTCTAGSPGACSAALTAEGNTGSGGVPGAAAAALVVGTINISPAACAVPSGGIFVP
jgi:hypothetical protein